jgi:hypothetical protein
VGGSSVKRRSCGCRRASSEKSEKERIDLAGSIASGPIPTVNCIFFFIGLKPIGFALEKSSRHTSRRAYTVNYKRDVTYTEALSSTASDTRL